MKLLWVIALFLVSYSSSSVGLDAQHTQDYNIFSNLPVIANTSTQSALSSNELYNTLFSQGFLLIQTLLIMFLDPQRNSTHFIHRFMNFLTSLFHRRSMNNPDNLDYNYNPNEVQ